MKDTIDPRLIEQLDQAEDDQEVEALVIVADNAKAAGDERGAAGPLIDQVAGQVKEEPTQIRFMPKLGVAYVKGSSRFVRHLLNQDDVISASAKDSGETTSPNQKSNQAGSK
jgi:hypothetical protein